MPRLGDLTTLGETAFIDRLRRRQLARETGVVCAIGDDAAVVLPEPGRVTVVTTDALVEGIHFRREHGRPEYLGAKALEINVSDLAAMAARPRDAVVVVAAPATLAADWLEALAEGLYAAASARGVNLIGGDTTASPGPVMIAVTLFGDATQDGLIYRSGARPGDALLLVGAVGEAAAGLAMLEAGIPAEGEGRGRLLDAFLRPRGLIEQANELAASGAAHAMIDVSDGLSLDLARLCAESGGLGATVEREALPCSAELSEVAADLASDPLTWLLGGGEDYALLCAVASGRAEELAARLGRCGEVPARVIGRVESESGLRLSEGGETRSLPASGWEHWRAGSR